MGNGEAQQGMVEMTPAAHVETNLRCIRCGYNLRMLKREGRCPECGGLIAESLTARPWAGTERDALLWTAMGMTLLVAASGLLIWAVVETSNIIWVLHPDIEWIWIAFAIGPAGPKLVLISELAGGHGGRAIAFLGLGVHVMATGILGRLSLSKSAGMGRLRGIFAFVIAVGGLALAVAVAKGWADDFGTILKLEPLVWLLLIDPIAIAVMNIQIMMIAEAGGRRRAARWARRSVVWQVVGSLMGAVILTIVKEDSWWYMAGTLQGAGGVMASIVTMWIAVQLMREWRWRGASAEAHVT